MSKSLLLLKALRRVVATHLSGLFFRFREHGKMAKTLMSLTQVTLSQRLKAAATLPTPRKTWQSGKLLHLGKGQFSTRLAAPPPSWPLRTNPRRFGQARKDQIRSRFKTRRVRVTCDDACVNRLYPKVPG